MCTRKPGIFAVLSVMFFISFIATSLQARQVGKFSYRGDIRTLDGDTTIEVSDTMVAMSEKVRAFQDVLSDTISTPPSIFFIIDNSTSMSGTNGNDPVGNRFTVTSALIDTVMAKFPQAEVGLAVFIGGLYYNPASKPGIFQTITSASRMGLDSTGAFVPLLTLNQTYGTQTGYQILKEVLAVNNGALTYASIPNLQTGTNINSGFDAAIQAYSATNFAKENQFIIFLSDGEANRPTSSSSAFTAATNCPTTFTVYFTTGATVPTTIQTYTANCKINGYSTSNDSSNAWAYRNTTFDALMGFLMDHVLSIIIKDEIINPSTLVINSLSSTSWTIADSTFTFGSLFPLIREITPFSILLVNAQNDTLASSFNVQTQGGLAQTWRTPYDIKLWDRDIVFQTPEGVAISEISRTLDSFQIRFTFTPGEANYNYTNASIEIFNTNTTVRDHEIVTLTKGTGNFFTGIVKRVVATAATASNNVLEHALIDTLIAVFHNNETPRLPLDTLRVLTPIYISPNARILSAATKDINGNGFIDAISVLFDNDTSITTASLPANFTVQFGATNLTVTGIEQINARQYRLLIQEPAATAALQTSWTPTLTTSALERVDNMTVTCIDSCPPVIYRVIKKMVDEIDHTTDTVRVLFSEKIINPDGTPFTITRQPGTVFQVWWGADGDANADSLLAGIPGFFTLVSDSILYFTMSNNKNLTAANWVNIKASETPLRDKIGNLPSSNNRRVQVEVEKSIINARIAIAATKDNNGNGYIDAIVLTFDKAPVLTPSTIPANFTLVYGITNLTVTGIENINPRQYRLLVQEPASTAALQTSWTPTLTTLSMKDNIDNMTITCIDSCPPVIYRVIKVVTDANNRSTDSVKVMFSEKIIGPAGTAFAITNQPPNTFAVWWGNTTVSADTLLDGITTFISVVNDSILYFMMKNNKDLGARNWVNIETASVVLSDYIGNTPAANNRKVPVELQSISIIKIFPNPAVATKIQVINGQDITVEVVKPGDKSRAKEIVLEQKRGGSIISIEGITVPPPNTGKVTLTMKIYDVAGNSVTWIKNEDLFSTSSIPGTSVYLYWNGFNQQKMKVAPGVYRAVVYVDYPPLSNIKDLKTISTVGIAQ
jgi:hypothetical protein